MINKEIQLAYKLTINKVRCIWYSVSTFFAKSFFKNQLVSDGFLLRLLKLTTQKNE